MVGMRFLPAFCLMAFGCGAQLTAYAQNTIGLSSCKGASTPEAVVQAQVEAYNSHDVGGFADRYAEQAAILDLSGKRPDLDGRDKIRDHYKFLKEGPAGYGADIVACCPQCVVLPSAPAIAAKAACRPMKDRVA